MSQSPNITPTPLSEPQSSASASVCIVGGIIAAVCDIFLIVLFPLVGILFLIAPIMMIYVGVNNRDGTRSGRCPYCYAPASVPSGSYSYLCPKCKKRSAVREDTLDPLD